MTFDVHTSALRAADQSLQSLSDDVARAKSYAHSYLHIERSGSGIFQNAVSVNDDAREALDGLFARLTSVLNASGVELRAAARYYDDTDHDQLVRMDDKTEAVETSEGSGYADRASEPENSVPEEPDDYEPPAGVPDDEPHPTGSGGGSW